MCARNGFIQAHGFSGRQLRPVRGAIDEGDIRGGAAEGGFGRYKGERVKVTFCIFSVSWLPVPETPEFPPGGLIKYYLIVYLSYLTLPYLYILS